MTTEKTTDGYCPYCWQERIAYLIESKFPCSHENQNLTNKGEFPRAGQINLWEDENE